MASIGPFNPEPYQDAIFDLAKAATSTNRDLLRQHFEPFLSRVSPAGWHRMLMDHLDKNLVPIEFELWQLAGQLLRIDIELNRDVTEVQKVRNSAFSEAHKAANLSFDVLQCVHGTQLREVIIGSVQLYVSKKKYVERLKGTLEERKQEARRRDSRATDGERSFSFYFWPRSVI